MNTITMDDYIHYVRDGILLPSKTEDDYSLFQMTYPSFHQQFVQTLDKLTAKLYRYLITFTLKPEILPEQHDEIEAYIKKQATRVPLRIVRWYIVREHTKSNIPHWHVAIETRKPLKKDRFNYYIKKYGNIDISKTKAQTLEEALNYMSKEANIEQIV